MRIGPCPRCSGDLVVTSFSTGPAQPTCAGCGYPERDVVADARGVAQEEHSRESDVELAIRLSANVGNYQTALIDGDRGAARAFLANVVAISELLLMRES